MKIELITIGENCIHYVAPILRAFKENGYDDSLIKVSSIKCCDRHYVKTYNNCVNTIQDATNRLLTLAEKQALEASLRWYFHGEEAATDNDSLARWNEHFRHGNLADNQDAIIGIRPIPQVLTVRHQIFQDLCSRYPEIVEIITGNITEYSTIQEEQKEYAKWKTYLPLWPLCGNESDLKLNANGAELMESILSTCGEEIFHGLGHVAGGSTTDIVVVLTDLENGFGQGGATKLIADVRRRLEAPGANRMVAFIACGLFSGNNERFAPFAGDYTSIGSSTDSLALYDGLWPLNQETEGIDQLLVNALLTITKSSDYRNQPWNAPDSSQIVRDFGKNLIQFSFAKEAPNNPNRTQPEQRLTSLFEQAYQRYLSNCTAIQCTDTLNDIRRAALGLFRLHPEWKAPALFKPLQEEREHFAGHIERFSAKKLILFVGSDQEIQPCDLDSLRQRAIESFPNANIVIYNAFSYQTALQNENHQQADESIYIGFFVVDALSVHFIHAFFNWICNHFAFSLPEIVRDIQPGIHRAWNWPAAREVLRRFLLRSLFTIPRFSPFTVNDFTNNVLAHLASPSNVESFIPENLALFERSIHEVFPFPEKTPEGIDLEHRLCSWSVQRRAYALRDATLQQLQKSNFLARVLAGLNIRANTYNQKALINRRFFEILRHE